MLLNIANITTTLYTKNLVLQHNLQTHIVMKNLTLLLFTILLLAFASCTQTNEDKARSLIEDQLKKTMNDWNSYEFEIGRAHV